MNSDNNSIEAAQKYQLTRAVEAFGIVKLEKIRNWLNSRFISNRQTFFHYGGTCYTATTTEEYGPGHHFECKVGTAEFSDFLIEFDIDVQNVFSLLNLCGWIQGPYHSSIVAGPQRDHPLMSQLQSGGQFFQIKDAIPDFKNSGFSNAAEAASTVDKLASAILLTEGKTDAIIINTAWEKLYKTKCHFPVFSTGIERDQDEKQGGANRLRNQLENDLGNQVIVGLFDNDETGNHEFKSLNRRVFEDWSIESGIRKRNDASMWGLLLPVPAFRDDWVTRDDFKHRYLEIEHYFSDEILVRENMKGKTILNSSVFEIKGNKTRFANNTKSFPESEFEQFEHMFATLASIDAKFSAVSSE